LLRAKDMTNSNKSKRDSLKDYYLPFLFLHLYGENECFSPHNETTFSEYKNHILKLLGTIKMAISQTIKTTDKYHVNNFSALISECKNEIKKAKSFHAVSCATISFQTKLIFNILGHVPSNSSKRKVTNQPSNWQLDLYRTINYTQNREQKFNLLKNIIKEGFLKEDFKNYTEATKKYQDAHLKGEDLFDWFKRLYPPKVFRHILQRLKPRN